MMLKTVSTGARRWILLAVVAIVLVLVALSVLSKVYIDLLWFREVGFANVFWTRARTNVLLGLIFGLLFFALLYANLLIVRRTVPPMRALSPEQEAIERVRQLAEPYLRWLIPLGSAFVALIVGISASHQWSTFLLWRHGRGLSFNSPDPLFHRDPGFYIFALPWWHFLQSWLFSSFLGVTLIVVVAHFIWGNIQPGAPAFADKAPPLVRAHVSVLLGLVLLARAWGYYLGRFDLLTSDRGAVAGASYTDIRAQLPALNVLTLVAAICAVLFLVNIRLRRWSLPIIAVGLLAAVSILLGRAYPAFVQQFSVKPQELQRETPYIADNIDGTRKAFGLDKIDLKNPNPDLAASAADLAANEATTSNIRLWRPSVIQENFAQQRVQPYYEFRDVDVDRYPLGPNQDQRVLMISGREVSQSGIPAGGRTWQNTHLIYTHGFGAVAAQVNTATPEGQPSLTLRNLPPEGEPAITQPRIYFGELNDVPFVMTNTNTDELDYEGAPPEARQPYQGTGGIEMGNVVRRALFAWRFNDLNLLISNLINPDSRIMINRQLQERAPKPAPFLKFDGDPYLAVIDGKLQWIYDAYTTTNAYPYSQPVDLGAATDGALNGSANYIRNSVKVVVDAYNGTMTYYLMDPDDPIAAAWSKAFPGLFTPGTEAPPALRAHFRYPENLFQVQATQYRTYHVTEPTIFFQKQDVWQIPPDPTVSSNANTGTGAMHPYYVLMRLPNTDEERFHLILPFTPEGRQNMTSWMAANSDPEGYGSITAYNFPPNRTVDGPAQVYSRINQASEFSQFRTLQGQQGSNVTFGDLLVIPIGNSVIYVVPAYVRSEQQQQQSIPELKKVVVVNGGTVSIGNTLAEALAASVGQPAPSGGTGGGSTPGTGGGTGTGGTGGGGTSSAQVNDLLNQAIGHFTKADEALRNGDLAGYQTELAAAQQAVRQANDLSTTGSTTTTAPATTATTVPAGGTTTAGVPTTPTTAAAAGGRTSTAGASTAGATTTTGRST